MYNASRDPPKRLISPARTLRVAIVAFREVICRRAGASSIFREQRAPAKSLKGLGPWRNEQSSSAATTLLAFPPRRGQFFVELIVLPSFLLATPLSNPAIPRTRFQKETFFGSSSDKSLSGGWFFHPSSLLPIVPLADVYRDRLIRLFSTGRCRAERADFTAAEPRFTLCFLHESFFFYGINYH